jgi:hypothetical protein
MKGGRRHQMGGSSERFGRLKINPALMFSTISGFPLPDMHPVGFFKPLIPLPIADYFPQSGAETALSQSLPLRKFLDDPDVVHFQVDQLG